VSALTQRVADTRAKRDRLVAASNASNGGAVFGPILQTIKNANGGGQSGAVQP
jgi:hypothetical protein